MSARDDAVVSWLNPLRDGIITSLGGLRVNPVNGGLEFHDGLDIACPVGTAVFAAHAGDVLASGYSPSYGYYVRILYDNGYSVVYAHLSETAVNRGDAVSRGQVVAYSGNTGRSTGPHLHYSLFKGGQYVNAYEYVSFPVNDRIMAAGGAS